MGEVSLGRLYVLRAIYLFIAGGLAAMIWPGLLGGPSEWPLMNGVVTCMLAAVSILAALGIRYSLSMLPVLFFEFIWKAIWLVAVALPLWSAGQLDARVTQTAFECLLGVVLVPIVLPWRYVLGRYVRQPGDHWRSASTLTSDGRL